VADSFVAGDGFFETLGAAPPLGRYFNAGDYAADGAGHLGLWPWLPAVVEAAAGGQGVA
jgi:hypothetical protein